MKSVIKKYIPAAAVGVAMLLSSCSDSFLDKEPTDYVSGDQLQEVAKWNPKITMGQALGAYSTTFAMSTGGVGGHDDFGQKAVDIATDMMSGDMINTNTSYSWFILAGQLTCTTKTASRYTYQFWRYYYSLVKSANEIIDAAGGNDAKPESAGNKYYYAEAKTIRAYAYFNLVNLYAPTYSEDKAAKAVPIYKSQTDATAGTRATVDEVYSFIIDDLTNAISFFDEAVKDNGGDLRTSKEEANGSVARGFLAYAYLMKGDYANAAKVSEEVISSGEYKLETPAEATNGFSAMSDSWMWGIQLTTSNSPALPTFWGHMDVYTYSYAFAGNLKLMDTNLAAEIPSTDIRKNWISTQGDLGQQKFYDSHKILGNSTNGGWYDAEVYMRYPEMLLINAEANARNNNLSAAKASLKTLLEQRDTEAAAKVDGMDQTALLNEIWFNWRVEMWGEGRSLLTMKRFKKSITRCPEDACLPGTKYDYNDTRLVFQIPERETQNNPNLR